MGAKEVAREVAEEVGDREVDEDGSVGELKFDVWLGPSPRIEGEKMGKGTIPALEGSGDGLG